MLPCRFPVVVMSLTVLVSGLAAQSSNDEAVRDRYLESALRNPRRGVAVERLYQLALQTDGVDALVGRLKAQAGTDRNADAYTLIGLIQDMRGREAEALEAYRQAIETDGKLGYPRYCVGLIHLARTEYDAGVGALEEALKCEFPAEDELEVRKALGRCFLRSRQFEKAKQVWSELVKLAPEDSVTLKELTALLVEEEQWDEALSYYQRLRDLQKDRPYQAVLCTMAMGQVEARRGRFDDALARYEEALAQVKPDSWLAIEIRTRVQELFRKRNDLSGLVEYYQKRLGGTDSSDVWTMILHAQLLVELDRAKEARPWYEKALELSPKDTEVRLAYIRLLELQKDFDAAIKQYETLLVDKPDQAMWLEAVGALHLKSGKDDGKAKAVECWEKIAATNAKDPSSMVQVAEIFRANRMDEKAGEYFRKAIELAPDVGQYREYYGEFLIKCDKRDEALSVLKEIAEGPRRKFETLMRLADVLSYLQYPEEAVAAARDAVSVNKDSFDARMLLARLLDRQEEYDAALAELAEAARLASNDYFASMVVDQRIVTLQHAKRLEETFRQGLEAIEKAPASAAGPYLECAKMAMACSRVDDANKLIGQALEKGGDSVPALELAAKVYARGNDSARLIETLRRLAELAPQNRKEYLRQLAMHYAQIGEREEAIKAAEAVIAAGPDDPQSHGLLAGICERMGLPDRSLTSLKEALKVDGRNVDLRLQYSRQLERNGEYEDAIEQLWMVFDAQETAADKLSTIRLLAESCYRADRFATLIDRLERMRRLTRDEWLPTMCLAEAYRQIEDLTKARELLNSLLVERPDDPSLLSQLVSLASSEGVRDEAIKHLQRLVQLEPSRKNLMQLADLQYESGRKDEALAGWSRIPEQSEDPSEAIATVMRELLIREESQAALDLLAGAADRSPENLELGYLYGCALLKEERKDEAALEFARVADLPDPVEDPEKARKKQEKNAQAMFGPSASYLRMFPPEFVRLQKISSIRYMMRNQMNYAASSGSRQPSGMLQIQNDPDMLRAASWYQYCAILKEQGKYEDLIKALEEEGSDKSLWRLAETYTMEENQQPDQMVKVLDRLAGARGKDPAFALMRLSFMMRGRSGQMSEEDFNEAKADLDEIAELNPQMETFMASAMIQLCRQAGRPEELKTYATKVASKELTDPMQVEVALSVLCEAEELDAALELIRRYEEQSSPNKSAFQQRHYTLVRLSQLAIKQERPEEAAQLIVDYLRKTRPQSTRVMSSMPGSSAYGARSAESFPSPNVYYDQTRLQMLQQFYSQATGRGNAPYGFAGGRAPMRLPGVSSAPADKAAATQPDAPAASLVALRTALESDLSSADEEDRIYARLALSYIDWWDDKKDSAVEHLTGVADLRPQDISLKMGLATLKYNLGDKEAAFEILTSIPGRYHPLYQAAQQLTLQVAKDLKRNDEARAAALRLFSMKLSSQDQVKLVADLRDLGLEQKAEQIEQRIKTLSSSDLNQLAELLSQRSEKGEHKQAAGLARQILAHLGKAGPNADYYRDRALRALKDSGDLKEMIEAAEKQLAENPNSLRVLMDLYNYYSAAGDHDKAIEAANKAVELRPEDLQFRKQLAEGLMRRNKSDAAIEHYRYVLSRDPSLVISSNVWNTARAFREAKKYGELLTLLTEMDWSKLKSSNPGYGSPVYQLAQIVGYESLEGIPEALPFLNKLSDALLADENQQRYQLTQVAEARCRVLTSEEKVFIRNWQVIGPFANEEESGWKTEYPPEKEPFNPEARYTGKHGEVAWVPFSMEEDIFIGNNAAKEYQSHENIVVYARTTFESAGNSRVKAYVGSDDGVKVWINGKLVHENNAKRSVRRDADRFDVDLVQGTNEVLLKISQVGGDWGFCFRTDPVDPAARSKRLAGSWAALRYLLGLTKEFAEFKPTPPEGLPADVADAPLGVKTLPCDLLQVSAWGHPFGDPHGIIDDLLKLASELNQIEPMREHLGATAKESDEFAARVWSTMLDLRLDRLDRAREALDGVLEMVGKSDQSRGYSVTGPLMWLDAELANREMWPESARCCQVIVEQYSNSGSSGLEGLLYPRWTDRLIKLGEKERAREMLLAFAEYKPQEPHQPAYAEERRQRNLLAAARGLEAAGYFRDAFVVATNLSRLAPPQNWGRSTIDEGKRLADSILKAHPELQLSVLTATVPLSESSIQLMWAPDLGGMHCDRRGNTYAAPMSVNSGLAGYEAEIQVAADWKGPYHRLGFVPAEQQRYVHEKVPSGRLLWYRVVLRNADKQVAVISAHVAGVAGKNLVDHAALTEAVKKAAPESLSHGGASGPARRLSTGDGPQMTVESVQELRVFGSTGRIDRSREYILGGFIFCEAGDARICRLALDAKNQPIRSFVVSKTHPSAHWVFNLQRLAASDELKYEPGSEERIEDKNADRMPAGQEYCRVGIEVEGKASFDNVFLVEYELADGELLKDVPKADYAEVNLPVSEELYHQVLAASPKPEPGVPMLAAAPLGRESIQVIWSAPLSAQVQARGPIHMQTVRQNNSLFDGYEAEICVASDKEGPYRKVTNVPAGAQTYVHQGVKPHMLLWLRLVLREKSGKVAAVSRAVPCVAGDNMVSDGEMETAGAAAGSGVSQWTAMDLSRKPLAAPEYVGQSRPFGKGVHALKLQAEAETARCWSQNVSAASAGKFLFGGWMRVEKGQACLGRIACDSRDRSILLSETVRTDADQTSEWVFVVQQLGRGNESSLGRSGSLETREYGSATDELPFTQDKMNVTLSAQGAAVFDDVFVIRHTKQDWPELDALPLAPLVIVDPEAATRFKERCGQADLGPSGELRAGN